MSVFKTTFSRALTVIPSDNCNVPSPILLIQGVNTSYNILEPNVLTDNSVQFSKKKPSEAEGSDFNTQYAVNTGDVVYRYDNGTAATIVEVIDKFNLLLSHDIFGGEVDIPYKIYQEGAKTGIGNTGCCLYISESDTNYEVITIGGDKVMFFKPQVGAVLPVQVKRVISGGGCIALW
jgi:hypothetical protein